MTHSRTDFTYRVTCLAVFGEGILLRGGAVQDLLALAVQDDQVREAGLLDVQCGEELAEHAACVWHQPLQCHTPHHLQCNDNVNYVSNIYLS